MVVELFKRPLLFFVFVAFLFADARFAPSFPPWLLLQCR